LERMIAQLLQDLTGNFKKISTHKNFPFGDVISLN